MDAASATITTVAGDGTRGYAGDGGPATKAQLSYLSGIAFDSVGNLYIADINNNRIRKVAGLGAAAPSLSVSASTLEPGQTTTLSFTPSGNGSYAYQWYQGNSGDTSAPVTGATGSSFSTPPLGATTSYWVQIIGSNGFVEDSATVTITVNAGSSAGAATDGPVPLWALAALAASLAGIASRRIDRRKRALPPS